MYTIRTNLSAIFLMVFMWPVSLSVMAQDEPIQEGIIDVIRQDENRIIIGDKLYEISSSVIINRGGRKILGIQYLHEGMSVGYNTENSGGSVPIVREVWILNRAPIDKSVLDD